MRYWVDLQEKGYEFSEGEATWIQALPLGRYQHPIYGTIEVTPDRVQRFAHNIKAKVRGADLDIDYDHKSRSGEAAGWVKDGEARADGLWLLVEWTKEAAEKLKNKAYRYFSPEFRDEWQHPKTAEKVQDVLFGGALTNRPFLRDILPINLDEVLESAPGSGTQEGTENMDPKLRAALLKRYNLQDSATDEEIVAAATADTKLSEVPSAPTPVNLSESVEFKLSEDGSVVISPTTASSTTISGSFTIPASQVQKPAPSGHTERLKKLAETDPAVAAMLAEKEENDKRLATVESAFKLSEVNKFLDETLAEVVTDGETKFAVPPVVLDEFRTVLIESPKELSEKFRGALKKLSETGLIELGQRSRSSKPSDASTSRVGKFNAAVNKKLSENEGMDYLAAVEMVAAEQPMLYEDYIDAMTPAATVAGEED